MVQEMKIKGSAEGRTCIGPGPALAGANDLEIMAFDERVLVLRWVAPKSSTA
jgi:hypothetical protein